MEKWREVRQTLRESALSLPETYEDHPWGESVIKVNKKIFVFLGVEEPAGKWSPAVGVKLPESNGHALSVAGAAPSGYGLGRAGWVTIPLMGVLPETEVLLDWVEESYRAVAPKKLVARLDATGPLR
ncbi:MULTISPECIES: MmcQ/YjbR family DNA-binding protein [Streptosporangium]|uniref:DNA-binding protein (MmcQ/YjbR family) n=1 Tax=Streptosporangium brasiliense TaxID=47480 RepID=A0ABT9R5D2_9ACTN|nr:MmcQ/YjbR family DNA-binding protein [Streptosporangium brasiliense]MDP9864447.1 putative DNA-binding protein (MmcQ/YjbR family) [Streptosporangium brasiliense]